MYLDEANNGESCLIKQPQKLNDAKYTSGFKIYNEFGEFWHQICQGGIAKIFSVN